MTEANKPEGFDPTAIPGAEVIFEDGDVSVVAVSLSDLQDAGVTNDDLPEVLDFLNDGGELNAVLGQFQQMGWAEDEVEKAMARHGEPEPSETVEPGPLFTSFPLLACVGQDYMGPEPIFRAHCHEILERVAAGHDVRPGTDAEILGILVEASQIQPFCGGLTCLYFRISARVLPEMFEEFKANAAGPDFDLEAYEKVNGQDADQHEGEIRKLLTRERLNAGKG